MNVNDPIGDMIARIRNAQMRKKPKVSTPASRLRGSVLDVLRTKATSAATPRSMTPTAQRDRDRVEVFRRRSR